MGRSRPTREETDRARAAKVAAAQETLQSEIARITTGQDWQRFLTLQARLHHYSANNTQLIWAQHAEAHAEGRVPAPEPTYVAGFTTWKALGRSVERGQRGYAVLAPLRATRRTAVDATGERRVLAAGEEPVPTEVVESSPMLRGFTVAHVFDPLSRDLSSVLADDCESGLTALGFGLDRARTVTACATRRPRRNDRDLHRGGRS